MSTLALVDNPDSELSPESPFPDAYLQPSVFGTNKGDNYDKKIRFLHPSGSYDFLRSISFPLVLGAKRGRPVYRCMGAFNSKFWHLLQVNGFGSKDFMSTTTLLAIAVVVFSLMVTGLFTSMREFQKAEDPSTRKDS